MVEKMDNSIRAAVELDEAVELPNSIQVTHLSAIVTDCLSA